MSSQPWAFLGSNERIMLKIFSPVISTLDSEELMQVSFDWLPSPRANRWATNFFRQNPRPGDSFSVQNSGPRVEKMKQNPTPWHNLISSIAKILMKKEHNSIRAVSFQTFHSCPFGNFLLL